MISLGASRYPFVPGLTPPHIVGGEGSTLFTHDGKQILDAAGGAVVANIGHGRPEIAEAAAEAVTGKGYVVPLWATDARVRLVERVTGGWLPEPLTQCLFVAGGSESVDTAIRIARQHHLARGDAGRWKVLGREISYHGATVATLNVGNHDRRREGFEPLLLDLPKIDTLDAELVAKVVQDHDPATIAALVVEPISGASGGALVPPDDYLPKLRQLCDQTGILLICDEVMTGFGRTGRNFAVDHHDVVPDILVSGKGLTGGYVPAGGVFATRAVVDPIADAGMNVMYFTFSGSDMICAVADRVLQIMEDEDLVNRAAQMGARLNALLHEAFDDHPNVASVRGRGLLQGIELVADRDTNASFGGRLAPELTAQALERGCWIYPAGCAGVPDAALFGPPFVVTESELAAMVTICRDSLDAAVRILETTS